MARVNMDSFLKNALKCFIAMVIFYLSTLVFFSPELLKNKTLEQSDTQQWKGMAKRNQVLSQKHQQPGLWNDAMFSGMPSYQITVPTPDTPVPLYIRLLTGFLPLEKGASLFFILLFCFWILLLCFDVSIILSGLGALTFASTSYNIMIIIAGHYTKTYAIAYGFLILAGLFLLYQKNKNKMAFVLLSIGLTLEIRANHYQITYYLCFVIGLFLLFECYSFIKKKKTALFFRKTLFLFCIFLFAFSTNIARLWMTWEYTPYSIRGGNTEIETATTSSKGLSKEYAFDWSQGKLETFTFLIPRLFGGGSTERMGEETKTYQFLEKIYQQGILTRMQVEQITQQIPLYWGDQPFTLGPIYVGPIICLLFLLGLFFIRGKVKYWILTSFILMLCFAWGENFSLLNYLFFDYFPFFNKFRSVSMALFAPVFLMVLLAFLTLQNIKEICSHPKFLPTFLWIFFIISGICLLAALLAKNIDTVSVKDAGFGKLAPFIQEDRKLFIRKDAMRSFYYLFLASFVIFLYYKKKIKLAYAVVTIASLSIIDLISMDKNYLNNKNFIEKRQNDNYFAISNTDAQILADTTQYRVLDALKPLNQTRTSYHHRAIGGYNAAKMGNYQNFIDLVLAKEWAYLQNLTPENIEMLSFLNGINMLSTKYITKGNQLFTNPYALPTVWLVEELLPVASKKEEISLIPKINISKQALFYSKDQPIKERRFDLEKANIDLTYYSLDRLEYNFSSSSSAFAVFSEIFYPKGWIATIDDIEVPIYCVNYLLRGMEIPAGEHKIVFEFQPHSYYTGKIIGQFSAVFIFSLSLIFMGMVVIEEIKKYRK